MKLTNTDYINILKYYNIYNKNIKKSKIKKIAEKLLANKLCKCIKNVDINNEKYSIPICVNNVIKKKNLKIYKFQCKKKSKLLSKNKIYITKTKKLNLNRNKNKTKKQKNKK